MGRFNSNRDEIKKGIEKNGAWKVAYGRELTETDALEGAVATGISIYSGNSVAVLAWLDVLVTECLSQMEASIVETFTAEARDEAERFAWRIIRQLLQGEVSGEYFETFTELNFKAGVAKFTGQHQEWNPVANPGGIFEGDTDIGEWQNIGPPLISYCPYVGFQIRVSGVTPNENGHEPEIGTSFKKIVSRWSGKVLDVAFGCQQNGGKIIQFQDNGQENQQWRLVSTGDGFYKIVSRWSGKVLDVPFGSKEDGTAIHQWTDNGQANQQWRLVATGDGFCIIVSRWSGKVLDVPFGSKEDGTAIHQWTDNGQANQQWRLIPV